MELVLQNQDMGRTILRPNDEIRIYSKNEIKGETRYVFIEGHVKNPGRYELFEENMTLYDLLFQAGGFLDPVFLANTF